MLKLQKFLLLNGKRLASSMMLSLRVAAIHCQSRRRRRRRRCCFFGFWLRTICWKAPAQRMDQISLSLSLSRLCRLGHCDREPTIAELENDQNLIFTQKFNF